MLRSLVSRVRPAPLQALLVGALRLDRKQTVELEGIRLRVNPASVEGSAMVRGAYEPAMTSVLRQYLRVGGSFLDLGANLGYFAVLASRLVGPLGTVVAVEPQGRLQQLLLENVQANDCWNVRLVRALVGAQSGTSRLHLASSLNTGASSMFRSVRYWQPTEVVTCLTLEALLDRVGLRAVDLVKIDIEGAEFDVLMAAERVLRSGVLRAIAVDVHTSILARRGLSPRALHEHLVRCGYVQSPSTLVYEFAVPPGA